MRVSAAPSADSMWGPAGALGDTLHSQTGSASAGLSTVGPSIARKGKVRSKRQIQGRAGDLVAKQQPLRSLATTFVPSDSIPLDPESLHELGRRARQSKRTASSSRRRRGASTSATTGRKRRGSPVLIAALPRPSTARPQPKSTGKGKGASKTKRRVKRARNSKSRARISKLGQKRTKGAAKTTDSAGSELQAVIAAAATAAVRQALGLQSTTVQPGDRLEREESDTKRASGPVTDPLPKATGVTTGDSRATDASALRGRGTVGQSIQEGNGDMGRYGDGWEVKGGDERVEGSSRQGYSGRIHAAKLLEERSARMLQAASALASAAALRGQLQGAAAVQHDRQ